MRVPARVHVVVAAGLLALTTACGSTAQLRSATPGDAGLGLGGPAGERAAEELPAVDGPALPGTSPGAAPGAVPAGPGAAPGAPAPAASRGSAPDRGAGSASRVGLPGVTATTITVGVIAADPSTDETFENAGLGAASVGNEPANWRAVADEINKSGGIAGRRVSLVFHLVNLTDPPATQGQAACARFTEDTKVAAVVSGYFYASAHRCLSQKGVPALLGTNYGVDSTLAQQTRTSVSWATPLLDRIAVTLPDAFQRIGKLKRGTTAGIFVTDSAAFTRSASRLSAELTRRGVKVVTQTVRDSETGDYSGASGDASAAVLRFRSEGVTEVMFLTRNAFEPTLLMQSAQAQSYKPTYLLSTQQYPAALASLAPADQLRGSVAVGWAPAVDLSSGYDTGPQAQQCLKALKERGRSFSSGVQVLAGLLACDGLDLLRRAAARPGALVGTDALLRAAVDPGTGFVSAVTVKTAFPGGRRDGVAAYRPLAFGEACGCFTYTGGATAM